MLNHAPIGAPGVTSTATRLTASAADSAPTLVPSLAVVVSSCDAFADVWSPFFTLLARYWPDRLYPLYLIANEYSSVPSSAALPSGIAAPPCGAPPEAAAFSCTTAASVATLSVGPDRGWATNLRTALRGIAATHLLYLQEDYLLRRAVDTPRVAALFAQAVATQAACLRLFPSPGPDQPGPAGLAGLGAIGPSAPYRVSLQAAIWERRALESLLVDGESGWHMETLGSVRSRALAAPFLSVERRLRPDGELDVPLPYLCTAVVKGKWIPAAVSLCRAERIPLDLARRPVETWRDRAWRRLMTSRLVTRLRSLLSSIL